MPVYHNRAIWPFVSAYGLKAAAMVQNVAVVDHHIDSLMRGAALNLSNMENLEWLLTAMPFWKILANSVIVATATAAGTVFFGEKDKRAIVAVPLGTMLFVYGFFIYFLDVSIPFFPAFFGS